MRPSIVLACALAFPVLLNGQTSSAGNSLKAWMNANCKPQTPPSGSGNGADADGVDGRKFFEQLRASLTSDRSSITSALVSIPLKGTPPNEPKRFFFRVWGNKVTAQVDEDDSTKRRIRVQGISDIQSLIDNGGTWSAEYAYERTTTCGNAARTFLSLHSGIGKVDAPGNDPSGRFAGNATGEGVLRLDLSEKPGDFSAIVGARASFIRAFRNSLLATEDLNSLWVGQIFAAARIYGADALTASFTALNRGKKYNPKFSIAVNMNR